MTGSDPAGAMMAPMRHGIGGAEAAKVRRGASRAGLTVVEVLVALVIVSVGMLGMAGTASLSLRSTTSESRELRALRQAERRLAVLSAAGCDGATSGEHAAAADAPMMTWTVGAAHRGARLLEVIARWSDVGSTRTMRLRSALLC